jgi:DNA-directed RNA polymerase II subunit RPB4
MMISEVLLMLEQRRQQHGQANSLGIDDDDEITLSEAFNDTMAYCERFSKFKTKETIGAVRNLLFPKDQGNSTATANSPYGLHKFEAALLANLCPREAVEAKTLIPSIDNKLEDDACQKLLDDIQTYRSFQ